MWQHVIDWCVCCVLSRIRLTQSHSYVHNKRGKYYKCLLFTLEPVVTQFPKGEFNDTDE